VLRGRAADRRRAGRPRESWTRGNYASLHAWKGEHDEALALAQRNYEITERLGDVFSRHWALFNLGFALIERKDFEPALQSLESADRVYMDAMGRGGEAEGWRAALIAQALLGVGRVPEALERARHAATVVKERGLYWGLPRATGRVVELEGLARVREALVEA
jgi:tetratricopeptide (TPR) repeat protein